jgi:flavin-dependent dehydrogenase
LAQFGRSVAIVEKTRFPRRHIGESLTSGLMPLLETLGLRSEIESADFLCSDSATVYWAGEHRRIRVQGGGLQVDRALFDQILLRAACTMPRVNLYQPSRIVDLTFQGGLWLIRLNTGETLRSRYLADAAGRARILGGIKRRLGPPTLAMYAYWTGVADCGSDTLIEAGPSEWYWGAPLPGGDFNATVFVDPGASTTADEYVQRLRKSRLIWPCLENATARSNVQICDATPFVDENPITPNSLKTGDAALSIDPLSSQGVQTAIGISLHAAVVLNTMRECSGDAGLAMGFYRSRLADSASFHSKATAEFYREQYATCGSDFWKMRSQNCASKPFPNRIVSTPYPDSMLRLAPSLEFTPVAAVKGFRVVAEDGIRLGTKTYAYVGNARPVGLLLREVETPTVAVEIVRRWSHNMPPEEALQILKWAFAEGLIEGVSIARG